MRTFRLVPVLFILLAVSAVTLGLWAMANRPVVEPAWPDRVAGYAYSPYHAGQGPIDGGEPTHAQIRADLELLASQTSRIRIYTVSGVLGDIPALAREYGMTVTIGAWLSDDLARNAIELSRLVEVANANPNVDRIMVGNEVLLHEDLTKAQLIQYIRFVKARVKIPVSTAEPWNLWYANRDLANECDFIAAHFLPYWWGKRVEKANEYILGKYQALVRVFPNKPIVMGEVGWPSHGRQIAAADANTVNQARFLRNFLPLANEKKFDYFIMEAFDQTWKQETGEGAVGAYWGVWNMEREEKFPHRGPIVEIPEWRWLVAIAIALAALTFLVLLADARLLRTRALGFLAVVAFASTTTLVWMAYAYLDQYATVGTIILGIVLAISALGVLLVTLVEAHEWAEAIWAKKRARFFAPVVTADAGFHPKVSIHVPCYNEPPAMVIETLNALAALNYPNYEVLVIDNNTRDPAVWEPVQAHCAKLNAEPGAGIAPEGRSHKFRFFHVLPLAGFKAGALNYALRETAADADIVTVIDSDYQVHPDWLAHLIPHFADPKIAIVQAPQDYRDGHDNTFKHMCFTEYLGFFRIGMVTRNDRNAIIQHGTMTMVRRQVLEEVGGWAEWCITEDAELGLRIFEAGHEAAYVEQSYGKGLIPDNFIDYQKQRFRWAFGAMQILRSHSQALFFGRDTVLTPGQRYHFIGGWLPWLADGFNLAFTVGAVAWSLCMIIAPVRFDPPLAVFTIPPLALFFFKWTKLWVLYRRHIGATRRSTLAAAFAGLALSYTVARAVLYGMWQKNMPFLRTPKLKDRESLWTALRLVREELALLALLIACAVGVAMRQQIGATDVQLWIAVLVVQATPFAASAVMSVLSARGSAGKPAGTEQPAT